MANRRKTHLDALERRLTGPKRIGAVRPSQRGQDDAPGDVLPPGLDRAGAGPPAGGGRPAERRVPGREDRADRVGRAAGGDPGRDRAEAAALPRPGPVRPDRQGLPGRARHARLRRADPGSSSPTATPCCSASTPTGSANPADRRRRQQEVENLLERYIDRSDDGDHRPPRRPAADQVRPRPGAASRRAARPGPGLERRPRDLGGRAAGRGAVRDDPARPGAARARGGDLRGQLVRPRGRRTAGPPPSSTRSAWKGRSAGSPSSSRPSTASSSNGSGTSPPTTCLGSSRCVAAFERRYPEVEPRGRVPRRLKALRRRRIAPARPSPGDGRRGARGRGPGRLTTPGSSAAPWPSSASQPAPAVARRWAELLAWHPSLPLFWPGRDRQARAEAGRVDGQGGRGPGRQRHRRPRPAAPSWSASRTRPPTSSRRSARSRSRRTRPGTTALERGQVRGARPGRRAREAAGRGPARSSATSPTPRTATRPSPWLDAFEAQAAARQSALERQVVDDLVRSEGLPNADFRDLIDRAQQFLADHPRERVAGRSRAPARRLRRAKLDDARHRARPAVFASNTRPTSRPGSSATRTT